MWVMRRFPVIAAASSLASGFLVAMSGMPSYLLLRGSVISYPGTMLSLPMQDTSLIAMEFLALGLLVMIGGALLWLDSHRHRIWGALILGLSSLTYAVGLDAASILGLAGGLLGIAWNPVPKGTTQSLGKYQKTIFWLAFVSIGLATSIRILTTCLPPVGFGRTGCILLGPYVTWLTYLLGSTLVSSVGAPLAYVLHRQSLRSRTSISS